MDPEPPDPSQRTLSLEAMAVRWRSPDELFAVVAGVTDGGEEVVVTGALGHVHEGDSLTVRGAWRRHARHGWQFAAERVRLGAPASEAALLSYLASVKHVGPRGAAWLLERHGPGAVLAAVDGDPGRALRAVPGIGPARIGVAVGSWRAQAGQRAVRLFLEEHGVPAAVAARAHRALGAGALERLRADPYALSAVDGIGFATADALAAALGLEPGAPQRLDAGLAHVLRAAEQDGHCHLPRGELVARAHRLLGVEPSEPLDGLLAAGLLVADGERVLGPGMDAVERRLGLSVAALVHDRPRLRVRVPERPPPGTPRPSAAQWSVVRAVAAGRLTILTGGPGTGKTSAMRALVELLGAERRTVRLCAPTGKAARRLAEATGAPATTIHRLLEWMPPEGFARGPDHPIEATDVLVVDEASMLSVRLADALLGAVGPRTHVLLVGDVDQLAPVGPGRVLDDLIASGRVPTVRLSEVFRQAARSLIVRAAHAINAGERPPTIAGAGDVRDFFLVERDGAERIFSEVVALAADRLPAHLGLDPRADVLVLAPMHKGPAGIDSLNAALRARLNPDGAPIAGTPLRVGDRVVQTRNDHVAELMNGELGVLVHHDADRDRVLLAADDGRTLALPVADLATLRLAHALSVHKSQGSQAPAVVVVLHRGHDLMLTRNLLYTAVTRAERACVVVGERAALEAALRRRDAHARHTRLAELVSATPAAPSA